MSSFGFPERKIERCGAGLDPVEQAREPLEGRSDDGFEMRLAWARNHGSVLEHDCYR